LILLDEPTVGIDPVHRVAIRRLLGEVAREATVVVATHLLEDLRLSGTLVVVIGGGRAVFAGSISELAKLGEHTADEGERPLEAGYAAVLKRAR
jgi:ABC-2 type transport system ATP-binding protein